MCWLYVRFSNLITLGHLVFINRSPDFIYTVLFSVFLLNLYILKKIVFSLLLLVSLSEILVHYNFRLYFTFLNFGLLVYHVIREQFEKSTFVLVCYSSHPPLCWGFNQGLCWCYTATLSGCILQLAPYLLLVTKYVVGVSQLESSDSRRATSVFSLCRRLLLVPPLHSRLICYTSVLFEESLNLVCDCITKQIFAQQCR